MARLSKLLFCFLCVLVAIPAISSPAANHPLGTFDPASSQASLSVSRNSPTYTSISLSSPNVIKQDQVVDYTSYQVMGIPGEPFVMEDGAPAIPQVSRFYRIPNTGSVSLNIRSAEYELIENVNSWPLQLEAESFIRIKRNENLYSKDEWYPPEVATMSQPMILRDFRIVRVTLHPVQVNPVTHQARVYHTLDVDLVANDTPGENELTNPRRPSYSFNPIYRTLISNLDETALDDSTTIPGSYLIISKSDTMARRWADSLAFWKKRQGFDVTIEARNNWTSQTMTNFIRNAYTNWQSPLEFVCLIGDPSASFGVPTSGGDYDHGYACGNNDDIEDIGVGRLSGSTFSEMRTINAKIMSYERNPWMQTTQGDADTNWFHRGLFFGSTNMGVISNKALMLWGAEQFALHTGINQNTIWGGGEQEFTDGIAFFFWRGAWVGEMSPDFPPGLGPTWKLPVTMTVTCGTGDFNSGTCLSEAWLVSGTPTQPRGGVCGIAAATLGTHPPQNACFAGGLMFSIANAGVEHLGHAMNSAKAWLFATFSDGSEATFSRIINLMGEPSLSMWTDVPQVMSVTHPITLNVGARFMELTVTRTADGVPVKDAMVVLWKGTETYERALTNENGAVIMPVKVDSTGDLLLTVTKRGHKPYLVNIPCIIADQMISVNRYTVDDDEAGASSGNGDGAMNPGETIELPVYLKNFGSSGTATNVNVTLTCANPHITILTGTATYPNLAQGDSALGNQSFLIGVNPSMSNMECALLNLSITTASTPSQSAIELQCQAGKLSFISRSFSQVLNPGGSSDLTVTLENTGTIALSGVTARLVPRSPYVMVNSAPVSFGNIAVGQQGNNNDNRFTLSAHALTYPGHIAPMLLIASTASGFVDSVQFTINVGTATASCPTGPDAYGYFAYDNTDVNYESHPDFNYVNITTFPGANLNIQDPGDKTSDWNVYSETRRLPFNFRFYGVDYDSITICSNGWMSFGDHSYYDGWRNYRIPAMQMAGAMVAPYWDDLQTTGTGHGVWAYTDTENHRYIIQWKAYGAFSSTSLDFEVILYDTTARPTRSGDGQVLVQYQTVAMNLPGDNGEPSGCSVGIQDDRGMVGLPVAYGSSYSPGSASIVSGRAILFTTERQMLTGIAEGHVTDAETLTPVNGATVSVDGTGYSATTNAEGFYRMDEVSIGTYVFRASRRGYNDAIVNDVLIRMDTTETVNLTLLHPEIDLSVDSIHVTVPTQSGQTSFNILNNGNGPLDYSVSLFGAPPTLDDPWDAIMTVDVTQITGNSLIQGCEFAANHWWVTGGGSLNNNSLYKFDLNGELVQTVIQPSTTVTGWFDLAFDSTCLYGSDGINLIGIDPATGQVVDTIPSPLNPSRAIAYDPARGNFWVADYVTDIIEINRQGQEVRRIVNNQESPLFITGLAWNAEDPDGYKLYIFSREGTTHLTRVSRALPATGDIRSVVDLPVAADDYSGGCAITKAWNPMVLVFGGIVQNSTAGDRLEIYEMNLYTNWITIAPQQGTIAAGGSAPVGITFHPDLLQANRSYRVNLSIRSQILDSTLVLPTLLTILPSGNIDPEAKVLPTEYALHQNYPNPFNPSTEIRYDLKAAGQTKLVVYNIMGQEVATLVDEFQPAGVYKLNFNASSLSSGIYFYHIESGSFTSTVKMILMK